MDPTDQTIEILKDIRDGVRETNVRIDRTNGRLEDLGASLNAKIEDLGATLGTRIDRTNERLEDMSASLNTKIEGQGASLGTRIENLGASLGTKIENLGASLGTRIDRTNERLEVVARRQTEMEMRLATEVIAVSGAVHEVSDLLREDRGLRQRVEDHERRLRAIETRTE